MQAAVSEGVANSPYAQGPAASVIAARKGRPPVLDTSNDAALARALADEIKARMLTYADARIYLMCVCRIRLTTRRWRALAAEMQALY